MFDNEICFFFGVYTEFDLAERLAYQIRMYYPRSPAYCIFDGTSNRRLEAILSKLEIQYFHGERLHLQEYGGEWTERMFGTYAWALPTNSNWLCRLEPDSYMRRPFLNLPTADIGGNIISLGAGQNYIQGGCTFYSRQAVVTILDSRMLQSPRFCNPEFTYARYSNPYLYPGEIESTERLSSTDAISSTVIRELKLSVEEWSEVYCRLREKCPNPERYAVVHPVKNL